MIVSTDWLSKYVDVPRDVEQLTERLTLSGLNLEGVESVQQDTAIDLEVTSNRPDCLGHIGVAREIAVLWSKPLKQPDPQPTLNRSAKPIGVQIDCPDLCRAYSARVIGGVKIGPSPAWLADRLRTLGIARVNNVVDATNYVMMECGQPLHAFDLAHLRGQQIIVREAKPGEKFIAINHQEYELVAGACVIADAERAVALAGVMGGVDSEVSESTADLLIESADFDPLATRLTARRFNLHSPSSYRFERGVDPEGIDWASRRCCELILELAGGELVGEQFVEAEPPRERPAIKLRFPELPRILGIEVDDSEVCSILAALGCEEKHVCDHCVKVIPPSWRADLTREIDLIEEVARIHGYDRIPEDAGVRMVASKRGREDRVLTKVRQALVAAGFYEAMTLSTVEEDQVDRFRPWTSAAPLQTSTPVLRRADRLRQSVVPSLLTARRHNESLSNPICELFEIAKVYLPKPSGMPVEKRVLAICSGGDLLHVKGVVEAVLASVAPGGRMSVEASDYQLLDDEKQGALHLGDRRLGTIGELSDAGREQFSLRGPAAVSEIDVELLIEVAQLTPVARPLSPFPPIARDLNIVVEEAVRWAQVESVVEAAAGETLESIAYQETYRDAKRLGTGKKSLLFSVQLRASDATMTNEQADEVRDRIVALLEKQVGGQLRA